MTPSDIMQEYKAQYDKEYGEKGLNIVTVEKDGVGGINDKQYEKGGEGDDCDGRDRVTVMKYYTVKPKDYYMRRHYGEHKGKTYKQYVITIPPRKFYNEAQVRTYMKYINKTAGRTLEDDEMMLLLKTISRGRQYQLTCLVDITEELKDQTVWKA